MARYSGWTGLDMSQFDPDVPLKHVKTNAGQTMVDLFSKMDPDKEWTPARHRRVHRHRRHRPHHHRLPDHRGRRADPVDDETGVAGFNFAHAVQYQDIADFIELVVPELQRRGTMWSEYEGSTFREKLYGPGAVRLRDDHPGRHVTPSPRQPHRQPAEPHTDSRLPASLRLSGDGPERPSKETNDARPTELRDVAADPAYRPSER